MLLKITPAQAQAIVATRDSWDEKTRKRRKAAIFAQIKAEHGLRSTQKIKFEIDNPNSPDYLVIKDGETGMRLEALRPLNPPVAKGYGKFPFPSGAEAGTPASACECKTEQAADVRVSNAKPALRGMVLTDAMPHQVAGSHATAANVRLKLGSVSLDDILELLRSEGETIGSYATTEDSTAAPVFIRGDRIFFVR